MNNSQFKRLVADSTLSQESSEKTPRNNVGATPSRLGGATPSALGSRMRSSIPMTPRSLIGVDFSRQLAEYRNDGQQPPTKRFKSTAAPRGTKLASGYQDRTKLRGKDEDDAGGDSTAVGDKAKRIKALEEMVKLQQIDQGTFEKLRDEIGVGGDLESTHLIKGLDWKLLRRVKDGEDVSTVPAKAEKPTEEEEDVKVDVDVEFDTVLGNEEATKPLVKEVKVKKGSMAPPSSTTGQQLSRNEILKQLKASRTAETGAKEIPNEPQPSLGSKFKKITGPQDDRRRWIEKDEQGRRREVLISVDAGGKPKRRVRWLDKATEASGLPAPDKDLEPLGMEVPANIAATAKASTEPEDVDDDIFAGVGTAYNPLGDAGEDSSGSDSEDGQLAEDRTATKPLEPTSEQEVELQSHHIERPQKPRNYFGTSSTSTVDATSSNPLAEDPTILAALKRAAALRQASNVDAVAEEDVDMDSEALLRRKKFLEAAKKRERDDAIDMDLGFGESRFGDDEEEVYWDESEDKKAGRKRGPKKKKGDKDSVSDVLSVLEGRKTKVGGSSSKAQQRKM